MDQPRRAAAAAEVDRGLATRPIRLLLVVALGVFEALVTVQKASAQPALPLPARLEVVGAVYHIKAQPDGRVIVAGDFTSINGVPRTKIARLEADGRVDLSWDPGDSLYPSDDITSIDAVDGEVWVCGDFRYIGGAARFGIAAIDAVSGRATAFDAHAMDSPYQCVVRGDRVFVTGSSNIGGTYRSGAFVALDRATGLATPWAPALQGAPDAMAFAGNTIYVTGPLYMGTTQLRRRIYALDATTGQTLPFDSGLLDSDVIALAADGNAVYAGGYFTSVAGTARRRAAAFDATTGALLPWNPWANAPVSRIELASDAAYLAGWFDFVGEQPRPNLARVDLASGQLSAWSPAADDGVVAIAVSGDVLIAGGRFLRIGGGERAGIARLDRTSGTALPLPLSAGGTGAEVRSLVADSRGRVIAAGSFDIVDGIPRRSLVRFTTAGQLDETFHPRVEGRVVALAVRGNTLHLGGTFTAVDGQPRMSLAAADTDTLVVDPWAPGLAPGASVDNIAVAGSVVYATGSFAAINGVATPMRNAAAIHATSGAVLDWRPAWVPRAMLGTGSTLFAAESSEIVAYQAATAQATGWRAKPGSGEVYALAVSGPVLYAGSGSLTGTAPNLVALDLATGGRLAWGARLDGVIYAVAADATGVYAGGIFERAAGKLRRGIARLDSITAQASDWRVDGFDTKVIALAGGHAWIGGTRGFVNRAPRIGLAAVAVTAGPAVVAAVEYHHAVFDHYFITADRNEIGKLDAGVFSGWARTGQAIDVYAGRGPAIEPVCRFFSTAFGERSSHFYTPYADECAAVKQNRDWSFEGEVFHSPLPVRRAFAAPLVCSPMPGALDPAVYRLYNNGQGGAPNHRYTTSPSTVTQMLAKGWIVEGFSGDGTFMCPAW